MTAQPCIDAAALEEVERAACSGSVRYARDLSPWATALLVDLEHAASLAAERAAAGRPVTLLALAEQLAAWATEPESRDHVGTTARRT